jgi:hypothetical protein
MAVTVSYSQERVAGANLLKFLAEEVVEHPPFAPSRTDPMKALRAE